MRAKAAEDDTGRGPLLVDVKGPHYQEMCEQQEAQGRLEGNQQHPAIEEARLAADDTLERAQWEYMHTHFTDKRRERTLKSCMLSFAPP